MTTARLHHRPLRTGFTLIEAAICTIIVATMFAAGVAAAGVAAKDRMTQNEIRRGEQLARQLMAEVSMQRYADPAANTIAHAPGASASNRSNWTHLDDYFDFNESPPRNRDGSSISGVSGWRWQAVVAYQPVTSFTGAGASSTSNPVSGLVQGVVGLLGAVLGATTSPTDTGLKQIIVTVTSPRGKTTTLSALRSNAGAVDRVSVSPGFRTGAVLTVVTGSDQRSATSGTPMLNTPAPP